MLVRKVNRRDFLIAGGAGAVGLVLATRIGASPGDSSQASGVFSPNAWLSMTQDGVATIMVHKAEMGQGVSSGIPTLVAEELDLEWSQVRMALAPADVAFRDGRGQQTTGGSTAIRFGATALRRLGATARKMLVSAASETLGVPVEELRTSAGRVFHDQSGQDVSYGELVELAAGLPVPKDAALKSKEQFRLLGQSLPRLDVPEKVAGSAQFGVDVVVPGMLVAVVERCPVFEGKLKSFDGSRALSVPGVVDVLPLEHGVAVVAADFFSASQGRQALSVLWDEGEYANQTSDNIDDEFKRLLDAPGQVARSEGAALELIADAKVIEATYSVPYLAHATMEPMACVAHVQQERCDVWIATQAHSRCQDTAAEFTGLPLDRVFVNAQYLGGGFGRRGEKDFLLEALELSAQTGRPVKVMWTREDDMQHDFYRPASRSRFRAALDDDGLPLAWIHDIACPSILQRRAPQFLETSWDLSATEGAHNMNYTIANQEIVYHQANVGIPVGFWRSVGHSHNGFLVESFLDELANSAGQDPYQYRRKLLKETPRLLGVLDAAAAAAGWDDPRDDRSGLGIACLECYGSFVATVVEVTRQSDRFRIERVVCAFDCGQIVNPPIVEQQIESGIIYGLTAALRNEITIEKGRVQQSNFHDYPMLLLKDIPKIDVVLVDSDEAPGGAGEPGLPTLAPALTNAILAAGGPRLRKLPIEVEVGV